MVSNRGDRGLFAIWTRSFWIKIIFPFPLSPAKWISDYFDKGCGANNGARAHRSSLVNGDADKIRSANYEKILILRILFGSHRSSFQAPNIRSKHLILIAFCQTNRLLFYWRERKWKYVSQWQRAWSKQKRTSIATVPDLRPTTVNILTHLISPYQLPLKEVRKSKAVNTDIYLITHLLGRTAGILLPDL